MKKRGELTMQFRSYKDGIFFYDLVLTTDGVTKRIVLPRYDVDIGWVEIFGFPPQFEWLALGDVPAFSKTATLQIDDVLVNEQVAYTPLPDESMHHFRVDRTTATAHESAIYTEHYVSAPQQIDKEVMFDHSDGQYVCRTRQSLVQPADLSGSARTFVQETLAQHGQPSFIWQKDFTGAGELPPIYYFFFILLPELDLTNCSGQIIEVGYMAGTEGIDATHGHWYKQCTINGRQFIIQESDYSAAEVETTNGRCRVKNTYKKELFAL